MESSSLVTAPRLPEVPGGGGGGGDGGAARRDSPVLLWSSVTTVFFRHRPWWRRAAPAAAMFKNTFQSGFLSVLYSIGSKPLQIWDKKVRGGAGRAERHREGREERGGAESSAVCAGRCGAGTATRVRVRVAPCGAAARTR